MCTYSIIGYTHYALTHSLTHSLIHSLTVHPLTHIYMYTDSIIGLCQLADVNHRLNRASDHDTRLMRNSLDTEAHRVEECKLSLIDRQSRVHDLQDSSEQGVVESCLSAVKGELRSREEALDQAETEEDNARKVCIYIIV